MESSDLTANPGDDIKASSWNTLVNAVGRPNITLGAGLAGDNKTSGVNLHLTKQPEEYWTGRVVAAGPASQGDIYTNVYWVQRQKVATVTNGSSTCNSSQKVTWVNATAPYAQIVAATNREEALSGTHFVPLGTIVRIYEEYDNGVPTSVRYSFDCTPPNFVVIHSR